MVACPMPGSVTFDKSDRCTDKDIRPGDDRSRLLNRTARICRPPSHDDANDLASNSRKGILALPPWQRLP